MHPDKIGSGQLIRHILHGHTGNNGFAVADMDLQVVSQAFDIQDVCQWNFDHTKVGADKDVLCCALIFPPDIISIFLCLGNSLCKAMSVPG